MKLSKHFEKASEDYGIFAMWFQYSVGTSASEIIIAATLHHQPRIIGYSNSILDNPVCIRTSNGCTEIASGSGKLRVIAAVDEVQWVHPAIPLELLWDDSLSSSGEASQTSILQGLLQQALTGPLLPAQQLQVLEQLQANPKRVFSCGLTPQRLPDLVELNPAIAIEVCSPNIVFSS